MDSDLNMKVRILLNKIAPDNYDSIGSQLRRLLFGDHRTKEKQEFGK